MVIYSYSTLEAFLGNQAHEALYKVYKDLGKRKLNSLDEIVAYYRRLWRHEWNDQVRIIRKDLTKEELSRDTKARDYDLLSYRWEAELEEKSLRFATPFGGIENNRFHAEGKRLKGYSDNSSCALIGR